MRLQLTQKGNKRLETLSELHLEELERLALKLPSAWRGLMPRQPLHGLDARTQAAALSVKNDTTVGMEVGSCMKNACPPSKSARRACGMASARNSLLPGGAMPS